jgi:hypothetical protein
MHWMESLVVYTHLCTVTVPEDAQTVKLARKYRSNKINLSHPYPIREHPMWSDSEVAVQSNGRALKYVQNKTDELSELAVQQDGLALQYVQNKTDELCKLAVQQNGLEVEKMMMILF